MDWKAHKLELIDAGYVDAVFSEAADSAVKRQMALETPDPRPGNEFIYEPLLVQQHVQSISQLLDRVLAYRREARDLEILAIKVGMDYRLFDASSRLDEQIEVLRIGRAARQESLRTNQDASKSFGEDKPAQVGYSTLYSGRAREIQLELANADEQESIVRQKHELQRAYHEAYRAKHREPGNAHNYAERAHRVFLLMLQDVREAYAKSLAVALGIQTIWGERIPPPSLDACDLIDALVDWNRDVVRFLEYSAQYEYQANFVIPLVQPLLQRGPLVDAKEFSAAVERAGKENPLKLRFELRKEDFGGLAVRLLSVGLSFGNALDLVAQSGMDRNATRDSYARLRAWIDLPSQLMADGSTHGSVRTLLASVTLFGGNAPADACSGLPIQYCDPLGMWEVSVESLAVYKDASLQYATLGMEGASSLKDLKLHLGVVVMRESTRPRAE